MNKHSLRGNGQFAVYRFPDHVAALADHRLVLVSHYFSEMVLDAVPAATEMEVLFTLLVERYERRKEASRGSLAAALME